MQDTHNRTSTMALRKHKALSLGDSLANQNKASTSSTNNENKTARAPLGQIKVNVPQPKAEKKFTVLREVLEKGAAVLQQDKAIASRAVAAKARIAVHVDCEDDENKENATVAMVDKENAAVAMVGKENAKATASASASVGFNGTVWDGLHVPEMGAVRQPLSSLHCYDDEDYQSGSPMVLDLSLSCSTQSKWTESEPGPESTLDSKTSTCDDLTIDLLLLPYAEETYKYLRELETRCRPKPTYMNKQTDITSGMRSILIDWLVEVAGEYNLHQETLQLTVCYVDRFLSHMSVLRGKLQLVGTASMFIASKYEEVHPPDVDEFVYITDDTYTKRQVIRMEHIILKVLAFDLAVPTSLYFLQRYCHVSETDARTYFLALYLSELTLLEADPYLQFLPSIIAGTSVCLARHTQDLEPWPESLVAFSGYEIDSFKNCMDFLFKTFCNAPLYPQKAIREKYNSAKFLEVSSIPPPTTQPL